MGTTRAVARGEAGYLARLAELDRPPERIFLEGPWDHGGPMVAIVGARDATGDGIDLAHDMAAAVSAMGVAVISGLAMGIDAAAHRGALMAGGRTGAVLGTPLSCVYPVAHRDLQRDVARSLGLLTELDGFASATRSSFASRNRLLAALADAVVVVQGRAGSGTLLTVAAARALGRPVGVVPWDPREPMADVPLSLLHAGHASVIRHAGDIVALLAAAGARPPAGAESPAPAAPPGGSADATSPSSTAAARLGAEEAVMLAALRRRAEPLEVAANRAGLSIAAAGAALVSLELSGCAERLPGGAVRRARGR